MANLPLVGIPTDRKQIGAHVFFATDEEYVHAVVEGARAIPVLWPSLVPVQPLRRFLETVDGVLLTGAVSNIEPHHYTDEPSYEGNLHDPARDSNTLPLVRLAVEMGMPLLAICRGFQEINVALGGTLYQKVHEQPGMMDHREDPEAPLDEQYALAHPIDIAPDGLLARITGGARTARINSLHGQGVARLAKGLKVEAVAPDGLVEAFSLPDADFLLALQWHPEWDVARNPLHMDIFRAFGDACRRRAMHRGHRA